MKICNGDEDWRLQFCSREKKSDLDGVAAVYMVLGN